MINDSDKCIYFKFVDIDTFVIVCLYVDDMLILSLNLGTIIESNSMLVSNFNMKDMGKTNVILDIKIIKNGVGLMLS